MVTISLGSSIIPKGLRVTLYPQILDPITTQAADSHKCSWRKVCNGTSVRLLKILRSYYTDYTKELSHRIDLRREEIQSSVKDSCLSNQILESTASVVNAKVTKPLSVKTKGKLDQLLPHAGTSRRLHSHKRAGKCRKRKAERCSRRCVVDNSASSTVVNLSSSQLSANEIQLLTRGLTFCPMPTHLNTTQILGDLKRYNRQLRLKEYFADSPHAGDTRPFHPPSSWMPPKGHNKALEVYISQVRKDVEQSLGKPKRYKAKDLMLGKRKALKSLMSRDDIVIKSADKGSAIVVMDKENYLEEAHRQWENQNHYQLLNCDPLNRIVGEVEEKIRDLHNREIIDRHTH